MCLRDVSVSILTKSLNCAPSNEFLIPLFPYFAFKQLKT